MPPRIAVTLDDVEDASPGRVIDFARRVEELGYESIWAGEAWGRDVFTILTEIACKTSKLGLATGIVNVFSRSPTLVAQSIASLDELSGGRAILGLGSSGEIVVRDWHGQQFRKPLQRTREYIEIVNLAVSGERVNYEGEFFQLKGFRMSFRPPREHIPIYVASMGPKNVALAGELADGWSPIFFSLAHLPEFASWIQEGAHAGERRGDAVEIAPWMLACATEDVETALGLARAHLAFYIGGMGRYYNQLFARYGFVDEAARIKELWVEKKDRAAAAAAVSREILDAVTVIGSPGECRDRILDMHAAGVDLPVLFPPHGCSRELINDTIEALAPKHLR